MMAAILLMQPVASFLVALITLLVLLPSQTSLTISKDWYNVTVVLDKIWRIVVGLGGFPALVTIFFQVGIPSESPWYILDVDEPREFNNLLDQDIANDVSSSPAPFFNALDIFSDLRNRRFIIAISACALILNASIGGLGLDNYRTLAQIWASSPPTRMSSPLPAWNDGQTELSVLGQEIYDILHKLSLHSIITISIGSIVGFIVLLRLINQLHRRELLAVWSLVMTILFAITAGISLKEISPTTTAAKISLYILCNFAFYLGK
jgi:MFS transporter, PHS family, inorganic phosphate transporter